MTNPHEGKEMKPSERLLPLRNEHWQHTDYGAMLLRILDENAATGKHHENAKPTANSILCYAGVPEGEDAEADARTDVNYVHAGAAMIQRMTPDIVVIDGIYRVGCAKKVAGWISISSMSGELKIPAPGCVIVDNAEWPGLQPVRDLLESVGLKRTSYVQPDHEGGWTTDVWSRE